MAVKVMLTVVCSISSLMNSSRPSDVIRTFQRHLMDLQKERQTQTVGSTSNKDGCPSLLDKQNHAVIAVPSPVKIDGISNAGNLPQLTEIDEVFQYVDSVLNANAVSEIGVDAAAPLDVSLTEADPLAMLENTLSNSRSQQIPSKIAIPMPEKQKQEQEKAGFYFADNEYLSSMDNDDKSRDLMLDAADVRRCLLCGRHGDNNIEGRLLYTGADTWVGARLRSTIRAYGARRVVCLCVCVLEV